MPTGDWHLPYLPWFLSFSPSPSWPFDSCSTTGISHERSPHFRASHYCRNRPCLFLTLSLPPLMPCLGLVALLSTHHRPPPPIPVFKPAPRRSKEGSVHLNLFWLTWLPKAIHRAERRAFCFPTGTPIIPRAPFILSSPSRVKVWQTGLNWTGAFIRIHCFPRCPICFFIFSFFLTLRLCFFILPSHPAVTLLYLFSLTLTTSFSLLSSLSLLLTL